MKPFLLATTILLVSGCTWDMQKKYLDEPEKQCKNRGGWVKFSVDSDYKKTDRYDILCEDGTLISSKAKKK